VSSPCRGSSHRSVALLGSLSVVVVCLALEEGPPKFRPGFTCPTLLGCRLGFRLFSLRGCHPLWRDFPDGFGLSLESFDVGPMTPNGVPFGLGWSPFARRY